MKEKTPLLHYFVCFQMHSKWLPLKSFIFYKLSEKLPVSLKLRHFRESRFSQYYVLPITPIAHYQVSFYANNYFE